jgi:Flp pilus assembly protein CpaB
MPVKVWLDRRTSQAPPALRTRVTEYALAASGDSLSALLAAAGQAALARVLSHTGDRSAALDLLAADALITLALRAQAEEAPERLEEFAAAVLRTSRHHA